MFGLMTLLFHKIIYYLLYLLPFDKNIKVIVFIISFSIFVLSGLVPLFIRLLMFIGNTYGELVSLLDKIVISIFFVSTLIINLFVGRKKNIDYVQE